MICEKYELYMEGEISNKQYLSILINEYPYDIDETIVYSLLNKNTYPHPSLLEFIRYFANISKFHIITRESESTHSLTQLWERMSTLHQMNDHILHTHRFSFVAHLKVKKYNINNPYAHLPLQKVLFLDQITLHHNPVLKTRQQIFQDTISKSTHFIYRDLSMNAQDFLAVAIRISNQYGIIYIPKRCISMILAITQLYDVVKPPTHINFICIYGVSSNKHLNTFYYDETNDLTIGLVCGDSSIEYFDYVKKMIACLYNNICIKKHDLPIQASMVEIKHHQQTFGVVFIGNAHCAKSEMANVMCELSNHDFSVLCIFDDFGTLHYLDNDIWATGSEIGSFVQINTVDKKHILSYLHDSILMNVHHENAHVILPASTHDDSFAFHHVDAVFYLNNYEDKSGFIFIDQLKQAKEIFIEGRFIDIFNEDQSIKSTFFANPFGVSQNKDTCLELIDNFFNVMYINNIEMGVIYTNWNRDRSEFLMLKETGLQLYTHIIEKLLKK